MENVKRKRENFEYEINDLFEVYPSMTDKDAKIVKVVASSISKILGCSPEFVISPGSYDQKHIDRK